MNLPNDVKIAGEYSDNDGNELVKGTIGQKEFCLIVYSDNGFVDDHLKNLTRDEFDLVIEAYNAYLNRGVELKWS